MKLFKRLVHRHTWRVLRTEYRYRNYDSGAMLSVKKCQCRECGRIEFIRFDGKTIVK